VTVIRMVKNDDGVWVTPAELLRERMEKMCSDYLASSVSMSDFREPYSVYLARDYMIGMRVMQPQAICLITGI
jgi:hypothetical protein